MEQKPQDISVFKLILEIILALFLASLILFGIPLAAVLGTAWSFDRKNEKIAKEIIDPKASEYIAQQYPGNDFDVSKSFHVFKDNCYLVRVKSRSSQDTHFEVEFDDQDYTVVRDTYAQFVLSGANTRIRIADDYETLIENTLSSMQGCSSVSAGFCRYSKTTTDDLQSSPNGLKDSDLILDGEYDVSQMGESYGYISTKFLDEEEPIHIQKVLDTLMEMDRILSEKDIGYYVLDICFSGCDSSKIIICGITKEDLTCADPLGRLQEMWEEQDARRKAIQEQLRESAN